MTMQKRNILAIFIGLFLGLVTVMGMSLFTFINLKFNSVYYAQHIPHKEGTEPDLVMLVENMGWIYTPEIDGIRYVDDGTNAILYPLIAVAGLNPHNGDNGLFGREEILWIYCQR